MKKVQHPTEEKFPSEQEVCSHRFSFLLVAPGVWSCGLLLFNAKILVPLYEPGSVNADAHTRSYMHTHKVALRQLHTDVRIRAEHSPSTLVSVGDTAQLQFQCV